MSTLTRGLAANLFLESETMKTTKVVTCVPSAEAERIDELQKKEEKQFLKNTKISLISLYHFLPKQEFSALCEQLSERKNYEIILLDLKLERAKAEKEILDRLAFRNSGLK
jgi:hypothetical protein